MTVNLWGAVAFGIVVGWVTYRALRRSQPNGLSDIATVIGAVGGATITGLFPKESDAFGCYGIGLALGFFGYLLIAAYFSNKANMPVNQWLGEAPASGGGAARGGGPL